MKVTELRELSAEELTTKLAEMKQELFNLRFQHAINQLDNPMRIKEVKKNTYSVWNRVYPFDGKSPFPKQVTANNAKLLVDNLNTLQKNPEVFEESLMNDVINSYNTFVKNKKIQSYKNLKRFTTNRRQAIIQSYNDGIFTPEGLEELATERNDENMLKDIKAINGLISLSRRTHNIISDKNNRLYDGNDRVVLNIKNLIGNKLQNIIYNSVDDVEANKLIEDFLTEQSTSSDPIISSLASNILKEFKKVKDNTTSSSNKKTSSEKPENKENKDVLLELKNNPNKETVINNMSKEELENLRGSDAHFSVILSEEDEKILKRLGINVSFEPRFETKKLYQN